MKGGVAVIVLAPDHFSKVALLWSFLSIAGGKGVARLSGSYENENICTYEKKI